MPILQRYSTRKSPVSSVEGRVRALVCLLALLLVAVLLSLRFGSRNYSLSALMQALLGGDAGDPVRRILLYARLPRVLAACMAGSALAVAGALIQAVLNNPMASPNVIGVNAGAGFCGLLAAALLPMVPGAVPAAAFVGALCTTLLIYLLAERAGVSRTTLILAGIAVNSILNAGVQAVTLLFPDLAIGSDGFMMGGFSGVTLSRLGNATPYLLLGAALAAWLAPELNALQLGEESAGSLGLPVRRVRFLSILAAALLAGAAVSFAGLLGFVGLLVPHIARRLTGTDNRWLFPASALLGAALVLLCDTLARVIFAPFELPVGIVLSLLGGPFFLWLLLRQKRRQIL